MILPDIRKAQVAGRTVLVRADLNVPLKDGAVADVTRVERFAPTVTGLVERGARVVVMTHLGRPGGEPNPSLSTRLLVSALTAAVGREVTFVPDCVGATAERISCDLPQGAVALLENLRFHSGEEADSHAFAVRLSINGDIYVDDAFSCAHRAHASIHALARLMPAYAGPLLLAEVDALTRALERPARSVAALVGGAKVSSKIAILKNLVGRTDFLIIGGGMANTFLAALGHDVGASLVETDKLGVAREILAAAAEAGCKVVLPEDVVVAGDFAADTAHDVVAADAIEANRMALDVGPATVARITKVVSGCRTLLWNGPLGAFEISPFGRATFAVARHAAERTAAGRLVTVAGGGDTAAALNMAGVADGFTYLSTAGGAFLEWLEGRALPGIEILKSDNRMLEGV